MANPFAPKIPHCALLRKWLRCAIPEIPSRSLKNHIFGPKKEKGAYQPDSSIFPIMRSTKNYDIGRNPNAITYR